VANPRKPTQLHVLGGTYRRDRHGTPVLPDEGDCDPPAHLSAEAKAVWTQLQPELVARGLLRPIYKETFEILCVAVVMMRKSAEILDVSGPIIRGRKDAAVTNPAAREFARFSKIVRATAVEFGLTPASFGAVGRGPTYDPSSPARLLG
jgi:P27 family predicted phage terminase small subunit